MNVIIWVCDFLKFFFPELKFRVPFLVETSKNVQKVAYFQENRGVVNLQQVEKPDTTKTWRYCRVNSKYFVQTHHFALDLPPAPLPPPPLLPLIRDFVNPAISLPIALLQSFLATTPGHPGHARNPIFHDISGDYPPM